MSDTFSSYQRRLFVFLCVATFFEGYDFIALSQILPNLRADLGLGPEWSGYLVAFINLGTVLAYPLVRSADRWGRKRVLTITIVGYTAFTVLSGLSPNVYAFAAAQWPVERAIGCADYTAAAVGANSIRRHRVQRLGRILPRSLHLPVAPTDGSLTENPNDIGVRLWT